MNPESADLLKRACVVVGGSPRIYVMYIYLYSLPCCVVWLIGGGLTVGCVHMCVCFRSTQTIQLVDRLTLPSPIHTSTHTQMNEYRALAGRRRHHGGRRGRHVRSPIPYWIAGRGGGGED